MKRGEGLEEALLRRQSIMDKRELVRIASRYGTSAEHVRNILIKMGFEKSTTFCGRAIWRKQ
jgi:hypothetical protein